MTKTYQPELPHLRRLGRLQALSPDTLEGPLDLESLIEAADEAGLSALPPLAPVKTLLSSYKLQDIGDYRAAIAGWFKLVAEDGYLVIVVPHAFLYERQVSLPSPWNGAQRRLYTPASLIEEVEEALEPNSYRVRCLQDCDRNYDYGDCASEPKGEAGILLVLQKIAPPAWDLRPPPDPQFIRGDTPDYAFEPPRTRVEVTTRRKLGRVLILKLDHLGDFIMGIPALERARQAFADAEITLVVGSWNLDMARALGVADKVVPFDAFPRNSTEEEANVDATLGHFKAIGGEYDLAMDLRTDTDTRVLLRAVSAPLKAGVGTRARFPFLDIFLPIDSTRNEPETAREDRLNHHAFSVQSTGERGAFRTRFARSRVDRGSAVVWGPYRHLRPGNYIFEPWIEFEPDREGGLMLLDVALDGDRVAETFVSSACDIRLPFAVERPDSSFEFRIWTVPDQPLPDFDFFGGRLIREGAASVLHQSEYLALLVELVVLRTTSMGMLTAEAG